MKVVIVGGSIAGLMAGIACKRKGHTVSILEKSVTADRDSHAAGIRLGPEAQEFLRKHQVLKDDDSVIDCDGLKFIDRKGTLEREISSPMRMTSWEILYYRLRACYDGHANRLCPSPPPAGPEEGRVTYTNAIRVSNVELRDDGRVQVKCQDLTRDGHEMVVEADRVIMADGSNSQLRSVFAVGAMDTPRYAGYVAWRGTVKESAISKAHRKTIGTSFLVHKTPPNYILVYTIPGPTGSTNIGERTLNFVWYYQCPDTSHEFDSIMTDADGNRHHATIPPGRMHPKVWERQKAYGREVLAPPFVELIEKTEQPFLSTVREAYASQASYHDGCIMVIGDALATFRPHIAMSVNQAALNCLQLERLLDGDISADQWQREAERYSRTTACLSTMAGDFAMFGMSLRLLLSATAYAWQLVAG